MQQVEKCGDEDATVDVQFTDLPNALIACKVPEDLFNEGGLKVGTKCCDSLLISEAGAFINDGLLFIVFLCVGCMTT